MESRHPLAARACLALTVILGLAAGPAQAANPAELLTQAQGKLQAGDQAPALALVDQAAQAIWNQMGLRVDTALLTREEATGYGLYNPREDNVYRQGEPIQAYLEPTGYKVASPQPGLYAFGVSIDVALLSPQGEVLWGKENFFEKTVASRRFNREFFLTVTLNLSGAPAGDYVVKLTVRDKQGGAPAEVKLPITVQ